MTEPIDQSADATGASDQPSGEANSPDLEALVTSAVQKALGNMDERFSGLQSLIDSKVGKVSKEVSQLKTSLSPEETEQLDEDSAQAELVELRRKVAVMEAAKSHPREAALFMSVMEAESFEDQIAAISAALGPEAAQAVADAAEAAAEEAETTTPEVDRNSPARPPAATARLAGHGEMTDEIAEAILKSGGKGALVKTRD